MYRRENENWTKHIDFMIWDMLCLFVALILSMLVRGGGRIVLFRQTIYRNIAVIWLIVDAMVMILFSSLRDVLKRGYFDEFIATLKHDAIVFGAIMLYLFTVQQGSAYSRSIVYMTGAFYVVLGYAVRVLWKKYLLRRGKVRKSRSMLVVTIEPFAKRIVDSLLSYAKESMTLTGLVLLDRDMEGETVQGVRVMANADDVAEYICREWVDEVFVYLPGNVAPADDLVRRCREMGVTVHISLNTESVSGQKQFVERVGEYTVLTTSLNYATLAQSCFKRALDILGGLVGTIIAGLVLLILGPVIYIQSPGPLIFKQDRVGKNGKRFMMYKVRSMYPDAEARKEELLKDNRIADGMMFKLKWDPRIIGNKVLPDGTRKTGIGQFIRDNSLDEFPQFFNVLKGDMSLVGTRPPTVDEWEKYEFHHRARLSVKPGITGLWQVSGRSEITNFEEVVRLDTQYISTWSTALDLKILFKTVEVVIRRKGAM